MLFERNNKKVKDQINDPFDFNTNLSRFQFYIEKKSNRHTYTGYIMIYRPKTLYGVWISRSMYFDRISNIQEYIQDNSIVAWMYPSSTNLMQDIETFPYLKEGGV